MSTLDAPVFVVDDDVSVCQALVRVLTSAGFAVEAFTSAHEFLERSPVPRTGCILLDVQMPDMTGPELHERISAQALPLPVLFLTGHGDVPTGVRAMKNGAVDFLQKPLDDERLLQAVREALERNAAEKALYEERETIRSRLLKLSVREREVMEHVIRGSLNKQIAAELGVAEKTVKVHRGRVMEKLKVRSVAELVRLCEFAGLHPS
jgi:FixJ family two-component response regulator